MVILMVAIYLIVELKDVIDKFSDVWTQPAIIICVCGCLLFIITFFGCIGSLRENTVLLAIYAACLGVFLVLFLTGGVVGYIYRTPVKNAIDKKLREAIVFYRDEGKGDLQLLTDTAQTGFGCCGSLSYEDWQLNIYFNCSSPALERCGVPYSCCKKERQLNRQCGYADSKTSKPNPDAIYREGCLSKSVEWIQSNLYLMIGIGVVLLLAILLSAGMAISLRGQIKAVRHYNKINGKNQDGTYISRPLH